MKRVRKSKGEKSEGISDKSEGAKTRRKMKRVRTAPPTPEEAKKVRRKVKRVRTPPPKDLPPVKENLRDWENFSRRTMIVRDAHLESIAELAGYVDGVFMKKRQVLDDVITLGIKALKAKRAVEKKKRKSR